MKEFVTPRVVVSKCLEFASCRWNGMMVSSHEVRALKPVVEFIPVCPEVEVGLGVPRKPIRLVESDNTIRLVQTETGADISPQMANFTETFLDNLKDVDGFILKDRSPSCGSKDVKVYPSIGKVSTLRGNENGFFGGPVVERFGHLAVENEGRLNNFTIREHFFTKLFMIADFKIVANEMKMKSLVNFHSRNKLLLMAYNQSVMREMGKVVANHHKNAMNDVFNEYRGLIYRAFGKIPRYTSVINVLMHALGYFSKELSSGEKAYFLDTLEQFRSNRVPLSVCNGILKSWIVRFDEKYLKEQTFFEPYPEQLIEITDSGKGRGV